MIQQGRRVNPLNFPDKSLCPIELRVPRKNRELQRTQEGNLILNQKNLKTICEMEGLYQYPQMNIKLYLHYKVISKISSLEKYVNLKTIYLENNVICRIEGLDELVNLQNLFLQNNMIQKMENLDHLKSLKILNLSNNNIFIIEGLSNLLDLQNLSLNKNYLQDFHSLQHLGQCSLSLTHIDLSYNQISADPHLLDLIKQVKCLYLMGNPLVRDTLHYRRTIIGTLPVLLYLDERGVEKEERMLAEAWIQGPEQFKKVKGSIMEYRQKIRQERKQEIMKDIDVHRKRKINVFENNILEAQKQIEKLRRYMREPANSNQVYFYECRISELLTKIKENQQYINSIYIRMGLEPPPLVSALDSEHLIESNQASDCQNISEESTPSKQESNNSVHSSSTSQQDSLKTYNSYDQLD